MASPNTEPSVYLYLLSIGSGLVGILLIVIGFLGRGFANQLISWVNALFKKFEDLNAERTTAWRHQEDFCRMCFALLNRVVGKENGKVDK